MKQQTVRYIMIVEDQAQTPRRSQTEPGAMPHWMLFLAYLAYLRAMRSPRSLDTALWRTLIAVIGLLLVVVTLVIAGDPQLISDVIRHWPLIP